MHAGTQVRSPRDAIGVAAAVAAAVCVGVVVAVAVPVAAEVRGQVCACYHVWTWMCM